MQAKKAKREAKPFPSLRIPDSLKEKLAFSFYKAYRPQRTHRKSVKLRWSRRFLGIQFKKMNLNRREFLSTTLSTAALGMVAGPVATLASKVKSPLRSEGSYGGPVGVHGTFVYSGPGKFFLVDLRTGMAASWEIPSQRSHSTLLSPSTPEISIAIDQDGPSASVVDLRKRSLVIELKATPGASFSGHGSFSPDGSLLYLAQYPSSKLENGDLLVFKTQDWKQIATYNTGGVQSHYVQPLKGGKVIAVGHYGKLSKGEPFQDGILTLLDSENGKVLDTVRTKSKSHSLCHMDSAEDDTLFITTRAWVKDSNAKSWREETNYATPVVIGNPWKKDWRELQPADFSEKMRLNLTVKVDSKARRALATHLFTDSISLWDLDAKNPLLQTKTFPGHSPMGLGLGMGRGFYIMHTASGRIYFLNPKDLSPAWIMNLENKVTVTSPHFSLAQESFVKKG